MKTKETSNQMGKCEKCGATQFLSYGTCNYNGICNGKIVPIEPSTREQALAWWNKLDQGQQWDMYEKHLPKEKLESGEIVMDGLAFGGGENQIEEIWRRETQMEVISEPHIDKYGDLRYGAFETKPNQKQLLKNQNDNYQEVIVHEIREDDAIVSVEGKVSQVAVNKNRLINQKQFKQFDEKLFTAYINKFSDEDKVQALKIISKELYSSGYSSGAFSDRVLIDIGRLS